MPLDNSGNVRLDAESWARRWQSGCGNAANMAAGVHGGYRFPDAEARQHALIGLAINAALVTGLYESLAAGHHYGQIEKYLDLSDAPSKTLNAQSIEAGIDQIRRKHLKPKEEKAEMLTYIIETLVPGGYVRTHRTLVSNDSWDRYIEQRQQAKEIYDYYYTELKEWEQKGLDKDGRRTRPPEPPAVESNPIDPRRLAFNELAGHWIAIPQSNVKSAESIQRKINNRQFKEADVEDALPRQAGAGYRFSEPGKDHVTGKLRDINRIMVVPRTPQIADDFFAVLARLHPVKQVAGGDLPRVLVEDWKLRPSGHFDRMAYVALDRLSGSRDLSEGAAGMVGEIKTIGAKMMLADYLTAPLYDALKELHDTRRYLPSSDSEKSRSTMARQKLKMILERSSKKFEERCTEVYAPNVKPSDYHFPDIPAEGKWGRVQTYQDLSDTLTQLCKRINTDALNREQNASEWQEIYIETGARQKVLAEMVKAGKVSKDEADNPQAIDGALLRMVDGDDKWRNQIATRAKRQALDQYDSRPGASR